MDTTCRCRCTFTVTCPGTCGQCGRRYDQSGNQIYPTALELAADTATGQPSYGIVCYACGEPANGEIVFEIDRVIGVCERCRVKTPPGQRRLEAP